MAKRWMILLAIAALSMVFVASITPAAAKKGKPAPPPPVAVTMDRTGPAGFATSCDGGPLLMQRERANRLRIDWFDSTRAFDADLPISWWRFHPAQSGDTFTGCHGGLVEGSADGEIGGFLVLAGRSDGAVELFSRFDYYWEFDQIQKGNKTRTVQTVLEFFEISAQLRRVDGRPFDWSAGGGPQTVEGDLEMRLFETLADGTGVGWHSFGSVPVEMTITIG